MRRWIIGAAFAGFALGGGYGLAQIVPALPFQLQNNTDADATQVMANFNQILNNVNSNGAKNGANSDITSLLGLTTPISPSQGGSSTSVGGTSTGSANAQLVATVVPTTFGLAVGRRVTFVAGFSNTDAATLNVAASGVKNIFRQTQLGPLALVGGEILVGAIVEVVYDGTQFQLAGLPVTVGEVKDFIGTAAPAGWALASGACVSQTGQGAALFTVASTTWGSCSAGNFALPDYRGRAAPGRDDMGGSAANRLTTGGSSCAGTTLATGCGTQAGTFAQANLPAVSFTNSGITLNNPAITATNAGGMNASLITVSGAQGVMAIGGAGAALTLTPNVSVNAQGSAASGGSGTAFPVVQPSLIVNKIVKY